MSSTIELRWEVPGGAAPPSFNKREHWAAVKQRMQPWRLRTLAAWRGLGKAEREIVGEHFCRVTVFIPFSKRRTRDPSNWAAPFVKGLVDELTQAGAWIDDDESHLDVVTPVLYIGTELRIVIELLHPLEEG